ncbi:multidrug effflux MFS transporter [Oceanospirillum sediminis]|uniref:Bcr/CflA family efflux transporter n=1 Tax=Oceanospirillum sediminis TaxID=2760088 RepID=A0A839INB9_9GAMM|nr:multidrug effflux MFS transporter [Oceanospirillum sediminis]MBB1485999.1 multidrug effflux MFS transporter [Oceanospirillum sediminis]
MSSDQKKNLPLGEFVALLALLMSLIALAIDAVLPAMTAIGESYQIENSNDLQLLVGVLFAGLAIGQIIYGPLSDSYGRKPAIYLGLITFFIGSLISALAESYETMLIGRFIQGLGTSGPKVVAVALVRDQFEGRAMARIMSFVMAVFIIMPALAPSIGAAILYLSSWHDIFYAFMLLSTIAFAWFAIRQQETLAPEKRLPFDLRTIIRGTKETLAHSVARSYTLASGLIFGAFVSYLSTSQLLFRDIFQIEAMFPFYFAALALSVGMASLINGRLVMKYGMSLLATRAMQAMAGLSAMVVALLLINGGELPLIVFMLASALIFGCIGLLFGNMNALAIEPLGHIAGVASSVIGALSTLVSVVFGGLIGQLYNQTLYPMFVSFALLALGALLVSRQVRLNQPV